MNKNRRIIRLTESQIHHIVKESVNRILKDARRRISEECEDDEFDEEYDMSWHIEDICREFGEGQVVINGTLGLWDGRHKIKPTPCDDVESAIYKCLGRDCELQSQEDLYIDENGVIHVNASHHDGTNIFTIEKA